MREFFKFRWLLLLFLPVPLGFWVLLTFILPNVSRFDRAFYFQIAVVIHSLVLIPIARGRARAISTILVPTALLIVITASYSLFRDRIVVLPILLTVAGYPGSLLLRNLPSLSYLREMKLIGWFGLAVVGSIIIAVIVGIFFDPVRNNTIGPLVMIGFPILIVMLTLKPANEWWYKTHLLLSVLATVITSFLLWLFFSNPSTQSDIINNTVDWVLGVLILTSLGILGAAGLRYVVHYFPRPQRLREAGLLDWRGFIFLGSFILGTALIALDTFLFSGDLPVPESAYWILIAVAIVLYWTPAQAWQRDRQPFHLVASVAILASISFFVYIIFISVLISALESLITVPEEISLSLLITLFSLAIAFGLVALLPWVRYVIETWAPSFLKKLGWVILMLLAVPLLETFLLDGSSVSPYLILSGFGTVVTAYFVAPSLSHFGKRCWLVGVAAAVLIISSLLLYSWVCLGSFGCRSRLFDPILDNAAQSPAWFLSPVSFLLHLLAILSLGLLAYYPALRRGVWAFLLFVAMLFISYDISWEVKNSGDSTAFIWLGLFGIGWLLAPLLPKRLESWTTVVWSGLLLLLFFTPTHWPLFPADSELVTYRLSLPIWISEQPSYVKTFLPIGLPTILAALAAAFLFAALVRSGQAVLARSRIPKSGAVTAVSLLLAACLSVAASYGSSTNSVINRLNNGLWTVVTPPEGLEGQFNRLLADRSGTIWVSTNNAEVARFDDKWQLLSLRDRAREGVQAIYEDRDEQMWVVTSRGLAVFDRQTDQPIETYNLKSLGLPDESSPSLNVIYQDSHGEYWVGSSEGVLRLADNSLLTHEVDDFRKSVQQIGEDPAGNLWYRTTAKIYYLPPNPDNQARRISADISLTYSLDLTTISMGTPTLLGLAMLLDFSSTDEYNLVEVSADGGNQWQCLSPLNGSPSPPPPAEEGSPPPPPPGEPQFPSGVSKSRFDQCGLTAEEKWGFIADYDLSQFVGQNILIRLSYHNEGSTQSAEAWNLLGAEVRRFGDTMVIPLEAWEGSGKDRVYTEFEPYQVMLALSDNDNPVYTWSDQNDQIHFGSAELGIRRLDPIGRLEPEPILDITVDSLLTDPANHIWLAKGVTSESRPATAVSRDGHSWQKISELGLEKDITNVTAMMEHEGKLWFAGRIWYEGQDQGSWRYVIAEYTASLGPASFQAYDPVNSGLTVGPAQTLVTDLNGSVWALIVDETFLPVSSLWFMLPVLVFVGLGYHEYTQQPLTRARRFGHKLQAEPETALAQIYHLLQTDSDAGTILAHLADQVHSSTSGDWTELVKIMAKIAPDRPIAEANALYLVAERLAAESKMQYSVELGVLYNFLAEASAANTINKIADWSLRVVRGAVDAPPMLVGEAVEPVKLPPFIGNQTVETLESLSKTATSLGKYIQVDSSQDKLVYLADALAAAERAARDAATAEPPESQYLRTIALDWVQNIRAELNTLSGRAELRLELRTRQIRRAEEVTLALRLQNSGRAVAENIVVTLQPSENLKPTAEARITLERLSSGSSTPIEFTVAPANVESARIVCQVTWDDRVSENNAIEFADAARFYEVAEEFQRIPNPYIVGHPVKSAEMFHGREDIFNFIEENLNGPVQDRTIVLHGQRRTGKTSILYQLVQGRLGQHFVSVLIDMQELALLVNSTGDLLGELAYQLARAVRKAGTDIKEPTTESFSASPTRSFNRFLDRLEDGLDGQRVVVMFDEFELIESKIADGKLDADLLNYFRSLMQHRDRLIFIFTGTHRLEEMSHDYWSVFFNIALYRRVSFLHSSEITRLIRQPVAGKLDVDELAVDKIISLTRGHAYFTQLICWALVNHCNIQARNYATINDVNDAVQEILTTGEAHFAYIWQQATNIERLALAGLAHTLQPGKAWGRPSEILDTLAMGDASIERSVLVETLDRLVAQEVLEVSTGGATRYRFQIEVLRLWVEKTKSIGALVERG